MKIGNPQDIRPNLSENPTNTSFTTNQKAAKTKMFANHFFNFFSSIPVLPSFLNFTIKVLTITGSKLYSLVHSFIPTKESKIDKCAYISLEDIYLISDELAEISKNVEKALENVRNTQTPMSDFMEQYFSIEKLLSSKFENFKTLSEDFTIFFTSRNLKGNGSYPLAMKIQNFSLNIPTLDRPFSVKANDNDVQMNKRDRDKQSRKSLISLIKNLAILQKWSMIEFEKTALHSKSLMVLKKEVDSFRGLIRKVDSFILPEVLKAMNSILTRKENEYNGMKKLKESAVKKK